MSVTIVSIGDEVLLGKTINKNASFLAKKLDEMGYRVSRQLTLADDPPLLEKELLALIHSKDIVIATGGLGPTIDDHTREVIAKIFNAPLTYNKKVASDLVARFGKEFSTLNDQATQPKGALVLLNPLGTAPGLVFQERYFFLPGVPHELHALFESQVTPLLKAANPTPEIKLYFFGLFESEVDPYLRELAKIYPKLSFGIYPALGTLGVVIRGKNGELAKDKLLQKFGDYIYASPSGTLEEAVHIIFTKKNLTLSLAESCTGGSVASALTSISGSSNYFLGSVVSYADEVKTNILNVPEKDIAAYGAVSQEVVCQMARGVLDKTKAQVAAAISGIAGPTGGSFSKPVGTVWFAILDQKQFQKSWKQEFQGDREIVIKKSVNALLGALVSHYG